ncbi:uncharacterized protein LOC115692272 isoform X2 [Syzygium oleosum]|uniref:uncharacterized protein LOC115692272 isoform X2 n=1 Tax=Syzygium oleosum TaxID=219896 RepID=UPI0011D1C15F|nr:uncharacterized protein LOC115692272 isoform X2 [Syzygium oleosum]
MLEEPELCASRILSPFREESGDEELSVLPRHTKVIVTGNNRTKSVLVGLQGVVKKAVGLGGWHWLVLKNGVEVKLQRNALSVLEHPTGNEDDGDHIMDSSTDSDIIEKEHIISTKTNSHKPGKPKVRHVKPLVAPVARKSVVHGSYRDVRSIIQTPQLKIDLAKLSTYALWRYCRHYKLISASINPQRNEMLNVAVHHFVSQRVNEEEVITDFMRLAKRRKEQEQLLQRTLPLKVSWN